ncbi:hypothetical protein BDK51DRAFT_40832 [Blyttiomyces helicus]|uniref:Uncharacterized protein n=1 Tax=Blyttiomyces helicus TaxID=388810 RepID=A0A4P9WDR0_9FUNG|nr:hypothetical protein BDK51DRAFT_40832 [Blyttiomyces helicus]|eukprot:RKO89813.1 hypothetical protein BDK51DRAFT_40832 [Blyttiomyces helicus]
MSSKEPALSPLTLKNTAATKQAPKTSPATAPATNLTVTKAGSKVRLTNADMLVLLLWMKETANFETCFGLADHHDSQTNGCLKLSGAQTRDRQAYCKKKFTKTLENANSTGAGLGSLLGGRPIVILLYHVESTDDGADPSEEEDENGGLKVEGEDKYRRVRDMLEVAYPISVDAAGSKIDPPASRLDASREGLAAAVIPARRPSLTVKSTGHAAKYQRSSTPELADAARRARRPRSLPVANYPDHGEADSLVRSASIAALRSVGSRVFSLHLFRHMCVLSHLVFNSKSLQSSGLQGPRILRLRVLKASEEELFRAAKSLVSSSSGPPFTSVHRPLNEMASKPLRKVVFQPNESPPTSPALHRGSMRPSSAARVLFRATPLLHSRSEEQVSLSNVSRVSAMLVEMENSRTYLSKGRFRSWRRSTGRPFARSGSPGKSV